MPVTIPYFDAQKSNDLEIAKDTIRSLIEQTRFRMFYLGLTNAPKDRVKKHAESVNRKTVSVNPGPALAPGHVKEMHVVYWCNSNSEVKEAERELGKFARQFDGGRWPNETDEEVSERYHRSGMVSWNLREYGGGRKSADGLHYVYILFGELQAS